MIDYVFQNRGGAIGVEKEYRNFQKDDAGIPEWLNDGPSSIMDMIELRGFEDDSAVKSMNFNVYILSNLM